MERARGRHGRAGRSWLVRESHSQLTGPASSGSVGRADRSTLQPGVCLLTLLLCTLHARLGVSQLLVRLQPQPTSETPNLCHRLPASWPQGQSPLLLQGCKALSTFNGSELPLQERLAPAQKHPCKRWVARRQVKTGIMFLNFFTPKYQPSQLNTGLPKHTHFHLINNLKCQCPGLSDCITSNCAR